ncbi:MAG: Lrp/AsnC ligand binding domain-containing protein [Anaerolineae bacterium]|nr:Lrp/AsnC ligand binding domain-containing protein [Anaerolineae bacterium]
MKSIFNKKKWTKSSKLLQHQPSEIKSFKEAQRIEDAFDPVKRGTSTVPLDKIVGSVGRYQDFDSHFRIKEHLPSDRLNNTKNAMRKGKQLPPVELFQIKDEYYVLDGNHRVAAAKELRYDTIRAEIVELIPSKNSLENIIYRERLRFREITGLSQAIIFTEVGQYDYLYQQILKHQDYLWQWAGWKIAVEGAAHDWYETIYTPLAKIIEKGQLLQNFPNRTLSDLYAFISYHQWEKGQSRQYEIGIDQQIPTEMEAFRDKMADTNIQNFPDMKRNITAFVLIHVKGNKAYRVVDKLFALDEIQEVHSVHGEVDIIIKFCLVRDLLSSDAEVISEFVQAKIRSVSGVEYTHTLIPGRSRVKN